ncbi:uncharacterized protein cubi_03143 [Cryptosporidium ubiquitum]|uniref:START domain-containing protein n=1 Tax=Cryptosporidium ubiquitum TaxID=857276 RepID=A0A1J4MLB2_9CRYT|nr:uncharacterized protein cubi_03143 [Cryptosporidium ubiquitum]OII75033.1 hypothetical protein cubi_03143 [Cryptosporidium ubiquitum]
MWGLWSGAEGTKSVSNKLEKQVKEAGETTLSPNPTTCASRNSTCECPSNIASNGAIIGDHHEIVYPSTEREKTLYQEYSQKMQEALNSFLSVLEDFNTAQESESNFKALGSCQKTGQVHVNLGNMGDALCSRFDSVSSSSSPTSKPNDGLSTYVAKCSFGTSLTPKNIFDFIVNIENKPLYDNTCAESSVIYYLGHLALAKQCYRGMMGVQGREFLIMGRNFILSDNCYVLVASSVSDTKNLTESGEEIPVTESYVRGEIKFVGFLIRQFKGETELFFAQKMDLGGAVPLMLQRIVLATQLQSLNALKKHLLDNFDMYFSQEVEEEVPADSSTKEVDK